MKTKQLNSAIYGPFPSSPNYVSVYNWHVGCCLLKRTAFIILAGNCQTGFDVVFFFLSERINSYIQYGWDELLLKNPNGKIQEEKRKENVNAEERLLATTFFDALNSSGNLCLEYANSNKTWLKLKQKHILITTSPNYSYL